MRILNNCRAIIVLQKTYNKKKKINQFNRIKRERNFHKIFQLGFHSDAVIFFLSRIKLERELKNHKDSEPWHGRSKIKPLRLGAFERCRTRVVMRFVLKHVFM